MGIAAPQIGIDRAPLLQAFFVSELQVAPRCWRRAASRHLRWPLDSLRHINECLGAISTPAHAAVRVGRATMSPVARS